MEKYIKLLCSNCKEEVEIVSVRKTDKNNVEILYICPYCGKGRLDRDYLYDDIGIR